MSQQSLQPNDKVMFDIEGPNGTKSTGFGRVTGVGVHGGVMILPDAQFAGNVKMINIRKVAENEGQRR